MTMDSCIFCRIVSGELPAKKCYEDEQMLAFHDIAPAAPLHILIIPKRHIVSMATVTAEDAQVLGAIMVKAHQLVAEAGFTDGFRLIANTGIIGQQEVQHLHFHLLSSTHKLGPMLAR